MVLTETRDVVVNIFHVCSGQAIQECLKMEANFPDNDIPQKEYAFQKTEAEASISFYADKNNW